MSSGTSLGEVQRLGEVTDVHVDVPEPQDRGPVGHRADGGGEAVPAVDIQPPSVDITPPVIAPNCVKIRSDVEIPKLSFAP